MITCQSPDSKTKTHFDQTPNCTTLPFGHRPVSLDQTRTHQFSSGSIRRWSPECRNPAILKSKMTLPDDNPVTTTEEDSLQQLRRLLPNRSYILLYSNISSILYIIRKGNICVHFIVLNNSSKTWNGLNQVKCLLFILTTISWTVITLWWAYLTLSCKSIIVYS